MTWYMQWSDSIKKRACRYLLQRYLGQYLEEKLTLDQLSVDIYCGTGSVSDVSLDVQALNELGEHKNLPFEFVDGFISNIAVSIPWANLFKDSIFVEVTGMQITIQPKQRPDNAASMLESMWSSMASSIQIAAECLKHESSVPEGKENDNTNNMEGLEIFASAIESILKRVKIKLIDTCVRLEHLPKDGKNGIAVEVKLNNVEYCDETANDWDEDSEIPESVASEKSSYSIKKFHCSGVSFHTDEFPVECRTFSRSIILDETNSNRSCDKLRDPLEPILIGKLSGYQEIRIKIKLDPLTQGPKVDLELNLGSFTFFLSPRQLYLLVEIMQSLASPHTQDSTNVLSKKNVGEKLMSSRDFKKVEQDLQETLNFPAVFQIPQPNQNRGWSSPCLDDGEEEFLPMKLNMTASCASVATNDTSFVSNTSAGFSSKGEDGSVYESSVTGYHQHKKYEKNVYDTEALEETSAFHVRLSSLAVVILHEDILTFGVDTYELTPSSVSTMRNLSTEFFEKLGKFALTGNKDFDASKDGFMKCCRLNHLRLLAATIFIEGNDNRNDSSSALLSTTVSAASLELLECLVECNSSTNQEPQYVELLKFMRSSNLKESPIEPHFPLTNKPDLRMHFSRVKKHSHSKVIIKLDVLLQFEQCWTEVDLSILERIATIINVQTLCRINSAAKNTIDHDESFTQAVESAKHSDKNVTFRVKSPFAVVKFRFPIPDLRPPHEKGRYPWWQRSVRKDVLFINLVEASFFTEANSEVAVTEYNLSCKDITVLFQEGNTALPIPFIHSTCSPDGGSPQAGNSDDLSRFLIRLCPAQLVGEVEDFPEKEDSGLTCSTYMETPNSEPSPFMSKKVVHESDTHHHAASDGEELVIPGSKEDIKKFIDHASEDAKVQVEISLPFLCVEFPTKHLYEVLYNRLNSDLSLYQTSFPKTFEKDYSYLRPVFSMCKSGLKIESDESDDESLESRNTIRSVSHHTQSKFSLNLTVSKAALDIFPSLKDPKNILVPDKFGEMFFDLSNANLFFVSNYKGKPQRNYVCLQVQTVEMFHKAVVDSNINRVSLRGSRNPPSYLEPVLLKSNHEIVITSMSPEGKDGNMLSAAVSTEVSERRVKTIRVACGINQVTLRHRISPPNQSWLTQLMDFFDVIDYPVKGYDSPQVITELHVHAWDSAIDYRPLYLPISCVVTLGNLSISSNIAARTKTSTLRFIAEEASLFITDRMKNQVGTPNLRGDYVSVIQLGLFELSLRLSEQSNLPKVDLKASNNMLHIRTCADSAAALAKLITYYASDGDLTRASSAQSGGETSQKRVVSDEEGLEDEDLLNQSCLMTESDVGRVNDMMEDAMQEIADNTENDPDNESVKEDNDVFYFPDEGNGFVSTPIDWAYNSDSDHDFCILELDTGITPTIPETGRPEVRLLSDKPVEIIENHFNVAMTKSDLLLSPKFYPNPVSRYRLTNMAIIWHMYGGRDFATSVPKKNVQFSREGTSESFDDSKGASINKHQSFNKEKSLPRRPTESIYHSRHPGYSRSTKAMNWQTIGGSNREHNILMQLHFNKVKFQHEIYPEKAPQASRQVLLIHEFEIRDRLSTSQINKFLYQYTSETNPKQSHANMMTIKAVHLRPDSRQNVQETCLKVSILPLRLNIDQDSLQFLVNYFTELSELSMSNEEDVKPTGVTHCSPVMRINEKNESKMASGEDEGEIEEQRKKKSTSNKKSNNRSSPTMFIRKFVFSPEVPIRIDYEGKHVDLTTYGPLKGLLFGLGQLNCLQIKLKRLSYKHGLLGIDKLISYAINEWLQDIKKTQVPCLIGAVGPMHALVQLFQGIRDLFWLPIEQYQKDGRIVRGIQRGANSFTTSTAIAALELTARIVQAIQSIAEAAFDMVSPGPSVRRINGGKCRKQHNYSHPADIREGVANAYTLVKEGLGETAETLVRVASAEAEQKGAVGAVGGVLRQIPPTVVAPIILASAATTNLLGGVRSQLAPDSRREATYKWKKNVDDSKVARNCK